jgi:hypothetical protein
MAFCYMSCIFLTDHGPFVKYQCPSITCCSYRYKLDHFPSHAPLDRTLQSSGYHCKFTKFSDLRCCIYKLGENSLIQFKFYENKTLSIILLSVGHWNRMGKLIICYPFRLPWCIYTHWSPVVHIFDLLHCIDCILWGIVISCCFRVYCLRGNSF